MISGKELTLNNVLYVSDIHKNLVSRLLLNKYGFRMVFEFDKVVLTKSGVYVGKGYLSSMRRRKHIKEENIAEKKRLHDQALKLVEFLCDEIANSNHSTAKKIFQLALFQATSHGIVEIVEHILRSYPNAIYLKNDNEQSIFHLAIECRHEKVFNLIHQVGEFKTIFLTQPDKLKNNALHLAGKLAPQQQLCLKAGPVLQMQRELQWFKGVEKLVVPRNKEEKNSEKYTPVEVFTDTHRELVKGGENWMRGTATSCSLVATLIATVVFAAAITVPGGNDSSGHPIFYKKSIFLLFFICDALALFSSITSVLFFLSILSSHYGEEDFLEIALYYYSILHSMDIFLIISPQAEREKTNTKLGSEERKSGSG
ncbi:ankyrin repeat-containing protein ITN1-like [Camellia sinensis]|uniref:ankyrin repeat-containing protein ITN1-like n=1 Tax=Camellia sinensis TaxID=4442 RepID=UPI0010359FB8|nr:ankyrin repeat-containing protein ITN1-like [Camellia sinensis]